MTGGNTRICIVSVIKRVGAARAWARDVSPSIDVNSNARLAVTARSRGNRRRDHWWRDGERIVIHREPSKVRHVMLRG